MASIRPLVVISFRVSGGGLIFPFCVCTLLFSFFLVRSMVFPYANRAAVASLPALALAAKPATVKEVIEDFSKQCPHDSVLESVQLIKGRTLRVVFASAEVMEDIVSGGLTFRDHPITLKTPLVYKWVTLLDLPYGIPESEIKTVLSKFGQVAHIRAESYMGLYTGTRHVKMEIKTAIPSRVVVAGHPCTVFYRGQIRSCFRCGHIGHEAKKCPQKTPAVSRPTVTTSVVPPAAPSETNMSTTPPTSPRSFACVVSGQVEPTDTGTLPSTSISPFPKEVLLLPLGPVDVTALAIANDPPGMDTDVQSQKRPLSPVSGSEETDTSERTRPRLEEQPPTEPTLLDPSVRDRSPLRSTAKGNGSTSDSSGKSSASNASVTDPSAAQPTTQVEPTLQSTRPLDRRPLSTRFREYCAAAPEYTAEEADDLVEAMSVVEHQLASPTPYENQEEIVLQQEYDHLKLDCTIAENACDALEKGDPHLNVIGPIYDDACAALVTFAAAHPQIAKAAEELYGDSTPANETDQSRVHPSDSPAIPDGQPTKPRTEGPSTTTTPSPQGIPGEVEPTSTESSLNAGSLNTRRRSRHKSDKTHPQTELASCLRQRTAPALPGVRKPSQSSQQLPDSPYTPLVTESGYLVTNTPSSTSPNRPQRPDTGAAGTISSSPSSVPQP